jgi:imidazolonepropionase
MSLDSPEYRLWRNARLATIAPDKPGLGLVENGAVACQDGLIVFAGAESDLPAGVYQSAEIVDCDGRWITPGLIDCHTHLVYAGDRATEFEQRLAGVSYEEIARNGGGIAATVRATRAADDATLLAESLPRLQSMMAEGVTTVEIKSGYGLDLENERKQLRVARRLGKENPVDVVTTFLGAHAWPPGLAHAERGAHLLHIRDEMLPTIAREDLADAFDAFCETIAFTNESVAQLFAAAKRVGMPVKLHADQLSNQRGAALAARFDALSADHLEFADAEGVIAMARAGTVGVLLPGAFYFLRETKLPPVVLLRQAGVKMAVATDCNPGTSPMTSLLLAMNMAATLFRLTVPECLAGVTREAARALGKLEEVGTLEAGKRCDLAIWDIEHPAELVYRIGANPLYRRVWNGQ